jgi:invasion protein IalB
VSRVLSRFSIIALAALFAAPAASQDAKRPAVIFSAWIKMCVGLDETCFIAKEGRSACGPVVAAVLFEKMGETMRTLRVILPVGPNPESGVRIGIDQGQPIARPFVGCFARGCIADYEAGQDLITRLEQGQTLVLEGIDAANAPMRMELPLGGFAEAHDGPPQELRVLEALPKEIQEVQKRAEAARRKAQCE